MFVFVTNLTPLRTECPKENTFSRSYKEYNIFITTKIPKKGQKQTALKKIFEKAAYKGAFPLEAQQPHGESMKPWEKVQRGHSTQF